MDRQIKGIVGTTIAAPYTVLLLASLSLILTGNKDPSDLLQWQFYEDLFALGTMGLLWSALPTLFLSLIAAGILNMLKLRSPAGPIAVGMIIGLCFGAFLGSANIELMILLSLSGAICGWIYWRIAIRQKCKDPDPITTA
ncbi:hypothetical protein [Microvirga solisilvae]|uniref:hypothetical protein n=1 Tax=Microvirga solisilvae TaxID=2919498 RepID=UPI001FAF8EB0|nr:hypothetical protein [Microvirga solisilvae]